MTKAQKRKEDKIVDKAFEKQAEQLKDYVDNAFLMAELRNDVKEQYGLADTVKHNPVFVF